jgi:hypothetical protein
MSDINFDLLDAAIEDAAAGANGYAYDQSEYVTPVNRHAESAQACGTALCLAGFAAVRAGAEVPTPYQHAGVWWSPPWYVDPETGELDHELDADNSVHVAVFAQQHLGLSLGQAQALFWAENTLADICRMRDHLRREPNARYEVLREHSRHAR